MSNLDRIVKSFVRLTGKGRKFTARQLHDFVGIGWAPASADRTLRKGRQAGWFNYVVTNRFLSTYLVKRVPAYRTA